MASLPSSSRIYGSPIAGKRLSWHRKDSLKFDTLEGQYHQHRNVKMTVDAVD